MDGIDKGLKAQGKVHFMKNARVDSINTQDKTISVGKKVVGFSKLLIATGGEPKSLPIVNGLDSDVRSKISTFRGVNDFKRLSKLAQDGSKMIAVVGGGFLGSELATALAQKKAKVVQVFPEKGNMSMILPAYLSKWTTSRVKNGLIC